MELTGTDWKVEAFQQPGWEGNSEYNQKDQRKTLDHDWKLCWQNKLYLSFCGSQEILFNKR